MFLRIFGIIVAILLFASFFISMFGNLENDLYGFTFQRLLSAFEETADLDVYSNIRTWFRSDDWHIDGDWGIFDFIRDMINGFMDTINFLVFLISGLIQVVVFMFYFVRMFFVS